MFLYNSLAGKTAIVGLCTLVTLADLVQCAPASAGGVYTLDTYIPSGRNDDQFYNVDIEFAGQTLPVLLDTGSGDLFVASDKCNSSDVESGCYLSKTFITSTKTRYVNETFGTVVGVGGVEGNQSIMNVNLEGAQVQDFGVPLIYYAAENEFQQGSFSGIFGMSPRNVSRNYFFFDRLPLVDTMITKGMLKKPLFSLTLPRLGDPESPKTGQLTIGDVANVPAGKTVTYNDIIDSPNYNYDNIPFAPQSWTAQLQGIRMNGINIPVGNGSIDPAGRYMSPMDTGSQQILFRRSEFAAIAAAFKGNATIVQEGYAIYFDCSIPQLLELKYHDTWFPVDPLDLIIPSDHGNASSKPQLCHAALGTWDRSFADSIIGVPFLRNVVSVYDYVSRDLYSVQPRLGLVGLTDAKAAVGRYASVYQNRLL